VGLSRSSFDYKEHSRDDSQIESRLTELSQEHRRFGHPRLHVLLRREGHLINHKRSERIYKKLNLKIKRRKRKKVGLGRSQISTIPYGSESVLAIDFVFDYIESGRRLKVLTMVDEYSKVSEGILVAHSIRGAHLGEFIEIALEVLPKVIRVDQGTEFTSRAFLDWSYKNNIRLDFTKVKKPNQVIESFNSRLRDECLNEHVFFNLKDAEDKINQWHEKYNNFNPHSSLGMLTPNEFLKKKQCA
jgi:putative transposase